MINKSLIFKLSLFGLAIAIGTVYIISSKTEPLFWLMSFIISAYFIAKHSGGKYFLHGFLLGLANCVWVVGAHVLLFDTYVANHPGEAAMMNSMPLSTHPRLMMLITGPIIGAVSGLVIGLFAFLASKVIKKPAQTV